MYCGLSTSRQAVSHNSSMTGITNYRGISRKPYYCNILKIYCAVVPMVSLAAEYNWGRKCIDANLKAIR